MSRVTGYQGIGPEAGKFVPVEIAFAYVCNQVGISPSDPAAPLHGEFKDMLVEWYFSGNWIEVRDDG